jgi:hypothetical protein
LTLPRQRTTSSPGSPGFGTDLSAVLVILPGDLVFTATPDGVGAAPQPPKFLALGQAL